jgi:hypothetical protein
MNLTGGKVINMSAASLGAVGTLVLFWGSFAVELPGLAPRPPGEMGRTSERNKHRIEPQRIGLALLMVSFILQGIGQIVE